MNRNLELVRIRRERALQKYKKKLNVEGGVAALKKRVQKSKLKRRAFTAQAKRAEAARIRMAYANH